MSKNRLDAYHFYEEEWSSYEELLDAFEWEVPEAFNMASYLCDRWADGSERRAVLSDGGDEPTETYTFDRLCEHANSLANYLRDRGVERGDRVGINMRQRAENVIGHVACWKLGAVSVPLSTLFGRDAVSYRLSDASAVACLVDGSNIETVRGVVDDVESLETVITTGDVTPIDGETNLQKAVTTVSGAFETVETNAEDDAIIIYTSGTTGNPKGVRHAHRVLLGNLPVFVTGFCNLELNDDDVFWTPSEWAWVATLFDVVFPALFYGSPVVAHTADEKFDPETAMALIERHEVTNYFAPPTALRMMEQLSDPGRWDVSSVRLIPSGGESLGESIVEWAHDVFEGAVIHEAYGQTEANLIVSDCAKLLDTPPGKIGRAGPGHEVAIVDSETAEATIDSGDVGEIAVRYEDDPICFKEYWRNSERTAEKVKNGWLLTEDLGTMDDDGYLEFVSRKDSVIISSGYKIGPVEIEEALAANPAVADAGVIGVPDDERGQVPKAFVVLAKDFDPSENLEATLKQDVRDRLAAYEYPRYIEFVDDLPKTTSGKVKRATLEAREMER